MIFLEQGTGKYLWMNPLNCIQYSFSVSVSLLGCADSLTLKSSSSTLPTFTFMPEISCKGECRINQFYGNIMHTTVVLEVKARLQRTCWNPYSMKICLWKLALFRFHLFVNHLLNAHSRIFSALPEFNCHFVKSLLHSFLWKSSHAGPRSWVEFLGGIVMVQMIH